MELQNVSLAPAPAAPRHEPDQRPSADAAASRRDPRPEIALPIPPDNGQRGAVNQSMMAPDSAPRLAMMQPVERVLKPYGVTMLPQSQTDAAIAKSAQDSAQDGPSDRV